MFARSKHDIRFGVTGGRCAAKSGSHPLLFRFRKQKMPGPMAIRMRSNGTSCGASDVKRLANDNQVVRWSMGNTMGTEQKVAVITGASQGFGAGLVKAYRDRNYRVIAISRSIKPSKDSDVLTIAGDVADPKTADRIVQEGLARFGRIDTLINNAGIFIAKPLIDYTEEDYASVLATNLGGFFRVTKRVAAEMLKQGSGHIVQITTSLIDHANSNVPSVLASMTKGGLNAATRSLAIEYAKKGVRVNAVAPGVMKTPMHKPETHEFKAKLHPMGRMGEIQDIVDAILFLENAPFVTGEILHVDGGQSAGH
jgi:NAD(P)-dependent dehydrogenase (short-subunit alcohol dehydrogenase family)